MSYSKFMKRVVRIIDYKNGIGQAVIFSEFDDKIFDLFMQWWKGYANSKIGRNKIKNYRILSKTKPTAEDFSNITYSIDIYYMIACYYKSEFIIKMDADSLNEFKEQGLIEILSGIIQWKSV